MSSNPWLTIWTQPRETVARVVSENPKKDLWWLATIYGFSSLLNVFQSFLAGNSLQVFAIFIIALAISPFWGYLNLSIWSWVTTITGKWLKGAGNFQTVRCAYAWSFVPLIINIPIWILLGVLFGSQLFTNFADHQLLSNVQVTTLFCLLLLRVTSVIWSIVIYVNALAEVQRFSILRAIGNILLTGLLITLSAYLFFYLLSYFVHPLPQATSFFIDNNLSQTLRYL